MKLQKRDKEIVTIYLANGISASLTIPIQLARKYRINKPSYVTIEGIEDGILIKKIEVFNRCQRK